MGDKSTSVGVKYKSTIDGWHVFSSEELPGLYVASQDAELAYNDVATAIEKLLWLDEGVKFQIRPEVPFVQFLAMLRRAAHPAQRFLTEQRYTVLAEAA
jgi:hypothetical protein